MSQVSVSIDPLACALALSAIVLAWKAYRRSTRHIVRLMSLGAGVSLGEVSTGRGPKLTIEILNLGLPIHHLATSLEFRSSKGGSYSITLIPDSDHVKTEFATGMRGKFVCCAIHPNDRNPLLVLSWIEQITNPRKQAACIVVKSDGFDIQEIPLYGRWSWFQTMWNRPIYRLITRFSQSTRADGGEMYSNRFEFCRLLLFPTPRSFHLLQFVKFCKEAQSNPKAYGLDK